MEHHRLQPASHRVAMVSSHPVMAVLQVLRDACVCLLRDALRGLFPALAAPPHRHHRPHLVAFSHDGARHDVSKFAPLRCSLHLGF